jgi:hypothetical protein
VRCHYRHVLLHQDKAAYADLSTQQAMIESAAEATMFKTKRSRIAGLLILIAAVLLLGLNFAITRSSPSLPANYNSLRNNVVRLYQGDLGFWLTGDLVKTPVTDWSFTDAIPTVQIETRTWYLLPHVLRTDIARNDEQLYLFSEYFAPAPGKPDLRERFPEARFWNRMVVRDPRIRVKIGNRLFDMRAYPLTDPSQIAVARQAFLSKYADVRAQAALPDSRRPAMHFFRLEPQWNNNS